MSRKFYIYLKGSYDRSDNNINPTVCPNGQSFLGLLDWALLPGCYKNCNSGTFPDPKGAINCIAPCAEGYTDCAQLLGLDLGGLLGKRSCGQSKDDCIKVQFSGNQNLVGGFASCDSLPVTVPFTLAPTLAPTYAPTTAFPTNEPVANPTLAPSAVPTQKPTVFIPLYFGADNQEQTSNTASGGLNFLDRQSISCNKYPLNEFAGFNPGNNQFSYKYTCALTQQVPTSTYTVSTSWQAQGDENLIYLDRNPVSCNAQTDYITGFSMQTRYNPNLYQFTYTCASYSNLNVQCNNYATNPNAQGNNIIYLDRQNVDCPNNQALQAFRLINAGGGNVDYQFTCCNFIPFPTNSPIANPTLVPSAVPTGKPVANPTFEPTLEPSASPTFYPTEVPISLPTLQPTPLPTDEPTFAPIATPTALPTAEPTPSPSFKPTLEPTVVPTFVPTEAPTIPLRFQKVSNNVIMCTGTWMKGKDTLTLTPGCGLISVNALEEMNAGDTSEIVHVCTNSNTPLKLTQSMLTDLLLIDSNGKSLISDIYPGSNFKFQYFSGANFDGASTIYSTHDGSLVHKVYPTTPVVDANDNVYSVIATSSYTGPLPTSCKALQ